MRVKIYTRFGDACATCRRIYEEVSLEDLLVDSCEHQWVEAKWLAYKKLLRNEDELEMVFEVGRVETGFAFLTVTQF